MKRARKTDMRYKPALRAAFRPTRLCLAFLLLGAAMAGETLAPTPAEAVATPHEQSRPEASARSFVSAHEIRQTGFASWYKLDHRKTASGEKFRSASMAAAHRWLPFGSVVRVTNMSNGRSVEVKINDRGPFRRGRIIDLTPRAAKALGMTHDGIAEVRLYVVHLELASDGHDAAQHDSSPQG